MLVINNNPKHHLSFDMVSKKNIRHYHTENIEQKDRQDRQDHIENFINEYLLENIEQGNDVEKLRYVERHVKNLSNDDINMIIKQYGDETIENDLINYYIEIFKHMEFVFEKHINMIENETDEQIKKNMTCLILFNAITYSSFLF